MQILNFYVFNRDGAPRGCVQATDYESAIQAARNPLNRFPMVQTERDRIMFKNGVPWMTINPITGIFHVRENTRA